MLRLRSERLKNCFVGGLGNYGGSLCGHFLSLFLECGRKRGFFNFGRGLRLLNDWQLAAIEIVDAHFVTVANSLGERAAQIML